jgi:hypothetical protein
MNFSGRADADTDWSGDSYFYGAGDGQFYNYNTPYGYGPYGYGRPYGYGPYGYGAPAPGPMAPRMPMPPAPRAPAPAPQPPAGNQGP